MKHYMSLTIKKGGKIKGRDGGAMVPFIGVASTLEEDLDGEIINPKGLISDYFLQSGFIDFNHLSESNPGAYIGEPKKAYLDKNGNYVIEGGLYKNHPLVPKILQLDEMMRKAGSNRKMGLSIEGDVLERNPVNSKRVEKALVTMCAITPTPKNRGTNVSFKKGKPEDILIKGVGRVRLTPSDIEFLDVDEHLVALHQGYKNGLVSEKEINTVKEKFKNFLD